MTELKGFQKKYLRGLAHSLNPAAEIGRKGITETLIKEIEQALDAVELIKIRFVDNKEKEVKQTLSDRLAKETGAHIAGMIGHVVILFRPHKNPEKRRITLPS